MNMPNLKTKDDALVADPAAAMDRFKAAMKTIIALPKSAVEEKPKQGKRIKRTRG